MSSVASGNEGWMGMVLLRIAEPLMQRVSTVPADEPAFSRTTWAPVPEVTAAAVFCEEDAERWDGLS